KHVIRHLLSAIAALGVPITIKTDNGPGYTSSLLKNFCMHWGIQQLFGTPHSPTGQAIIECTHST
ncbi:POK6 protein, partial [Aegotheles bennettii]|nr:POK6 protein [Aegotheles bennettii]